MHLGYGQSNGLEFLNNYKTYIKKRTSILPGEGARILTLTNNVITYINGSNEFTRIYNVTNALFEIIDNLMKYKKSLISQTVS